MFIESGIADISRRREEHMGQKRCAAIDRILRFGKIILLLDVPIDMKPNTKEATKRKRRKNAILK